jgi:hypothetical protein
VKILLNRVDIVHLACNKYCVNSRILYTKVIRSSEVCIATGYGLYDTEVGVRVPIWSRILISSYRQIGSGVHPGGEAAEAKVKKMWIIHFSILLHSVVLN